MEFYISILYHPGKVIVVPYAFSQKVVIMGILASNLGSQRLLSWYIYSLAKLMVRYDISNLRMIFASVEERSTLFK